MRRRQNTEELVAWCERHNLNASEIPLEEPECSRDRTGAIHYRLRRLIPAEPTATPIFEPTVEQKWEWVDVITHDKMPPMWVHY